MSDVLPVVVATVLAFLVSSAYYSVVGTRLAAARGVAVDERVTPAKVGLELARSAVLATVVAVLAAWADLGTVPAGLALGLLLWVGFPLVLWSGAVLWEGTSARLAALHGADWLVKLVVVAAVVAAWR